MKDDLKELRMQLKPRLTEYLTADSLPYYPPALTLCPACDAQCGILPDGEWLCPACGEQGDVVDYVIFHRQMNSEVAAVRHVCRVLNVKNPLAEIFSADVIMDMQFPQRIFIIDKLLTKGLHILAGPPKAGKSWLAFAIAHNVSCGLPVLGFPSHRCGVLYYSLEDTLDRVQRRLVAVTDGVAGSLDFITEAEVMGSGFEEQLTSYLTENLETKLVIIDTLQKIRELKGEKYSYAGDYLTMSRLKEIADRFEVAILLIHHTRKESAADPFEMISGTTGLMGCADSTFVLLKETRNGDRATLDATGRDIEDLHLELLLSRSTMTWEVLSGSDGEPNILHETELRLVQKLVQEEGEWNGTATELLEALKTMDSRLSLQPNGLMRILNTNRAILQNHYQVSYTAKRFNNVKTISLRYLPGIVCDVSDVTDISDETDEIADTWDTCYSTVR